MHCDRAILGMCLLAALPLSAQTGAPGGEWRTYGGDLGNTRYSALDQINASNFNKLQIVWSLKTGNFGPEPEYKFESTPLMAKVFYTPPLDRGARWLLWMLRLASCCGCTPSTKAPRGATAPRRLSGHGVAYWTDGKDERILYVTPGYRLIALDAKTGIPVPTFGKDGVVDLRLNDDQEMDLVTADIGLHSTPIVAGNTIIVGAAHRSGEQPRSKTNVKGYVRGFDVKTGKRLWIFHTIPGRGNSVTTPGRRALPSTPETPGSGHRSAWMKSLAWRIFRWSRRPRILMEVIARVVLCLQRAWSRSISRRANANGITSSFIMAYGILISHALRFW